MRQHQIRRSLSAKKIAGDGDEISGPDAPGYFSLTEREFVEKIGKAREIARKCRLCPNCCGVNRLEGETGRCAQGALPRVAAAIPHFGEEPPLSGAGGAGTVFFSGCSMSCCYCQNHQISQEALGETISPESLAAQFLALMKRGCHNIELVSPTPHLPSILHALYKARAQGLSLPIVYNSNGYLTMESLALLDGVIDIYLPDMKYSAPEHAKTLSGAPDYVRFNRSAVEEMFRQCGPVSMGADGIARKGVIIRILLLPGRFEGAEETIEHIAHHISTEATLSIMSQYSPLYRAQEFPQLQGTVDPGQVKTLVKKAAALGFDNIWIQGEGSDGIFIPDFSRKNPFER